MARAAKYIASGGPLSNLLPPELLGACFIYCLPEESFIRPARRQAPLLLLQVCSLWRNTALSTPQLWCSLKIERSVLSRPPRPTKDPARRIELDETVCAAVRHWLSRTANLPLSLSLIACQMQPSVIDVLLQYLSQCRHLQMVNTHPWDLRMSRRRFSTSDFRNLETITVHSVHSILPPDFLDAFRTIPKLREVSWADECGRRSGWFSHFQFVPVPWTRVKRFTFGYGTGMGASLKILLACLAECPTLEHVSLNIMYVYSGRPPTRREPLLLSELLTLRLSTQDYRDHHEMLAFLDVPRLRELTLQGGILKVQSLVPYVQRKLFALQTLRLQGMDLSEDARHACLRFVHQSISSIFADAKDAAIFVIALATSNLLNLPPHKPYDYLRPAIEVQCMLEEIIMGAQADFLSFLRRVVSFPGVVVRFFHWWHSGLPLIIRCPWEHRNLKTLKVVGRELYLSGPGLKVDIEVTDVAWSEPFL